MIETITPTSRNRPLAPFVGDDEETVWSANQPSVSMEAYRHLFGILALDDLGEGDIGARMGRQVPAAFKVALWNRNYRRSPATGVDDYIIHVLGVPSDQEMKGTHRMHEGHPNYLRAFPADPLTKPSREIIFSCPASAALGGGLSSTSLDERWFEIVRQEPQHHPVIVQEWLAASPNGALDVFEKGLGVAGEPSAETRWMAKQLVAAAHRDARTCEVDVDDGVLSVECRLKNGWLLLAELDPDGTLNACAVNTAGNLVRDLLAEATLDQLKSILAEPPHDRNE